MPDEHGHTPTPTPAPTPATPTPPGDHTSHHEKLFEVGSALGLDMIFLIAAQLFGGKIAMAIARLFQHHKAVSQTTDQQQTSGDPSPDVDNATLHALPFGIGLRDEAATGMAYSAISRRLTKRIKSATGGQQAIEQAIFEQFLRMLEYIATVLKQKERDDLRIAASMQHTPELQAEYWEGVYLASRDKKTFVHFMKAQGIVRDPSEFNKELSKVVAKGLTDAESIREKLVNRERRRLACRRRALHR